MHYILIYSYIHQFDSECGGEPVLGSGVHPALAHGLLITAVLGVNFRRFLRRGLLTALVLAPQLEAGGPEVHHEVRHAAVRHPRDDRLGQLQPGVLVPSQAELQPGLVAATFTHNVSFLLSHKPLSNPIFSPYLVV